MLDVGADIYECFYTAYTTLLKERDEIKDRDYKAYDENQKKLFELLKEHENIAAIDDMMYILDGCGFAPSILSNDGGFWAIAGATFQNIDEGNFDFEGTFYAKANKWSDTIRGAMKIFIANIMNGNEVYD